MTKISGKPFSQLLNLNVLDELRIQGGLVSALSALELNWVQVSTTLANTSEVQTTDNVWTEIDRFEGIEGQGWRVFTFVDAKRADAVGWFFGQYSLLTYRDSGANIPQGISTIVRKTTQNNLNFRARVDGDDTVYEVQGRNGQTWDWGLTLFSVAI